MYSAGGLVADAVLIAEPGAHHAFVTSVNIYTTKFGGKYNLW
jgi:hypothetical protein